MVAYYRDAVGLTTVGEDVESVTLGRGGTPLVVLRLARELHLPLPGQAGLFHIAILFENRATLAAAVASVASHAPGTFVGSADHLVSEAFYFADPEGNGVELYADRPRTEWQWANGQIRMDSLRLDPTLYLREHFDSLATPSGAVVGHVHLQVGDVATAERFYVDTLGFEKTTAMHGSALFVSAGGYHHHMAMNTWNSRGAGRAKTLGLGLVDILVPSRSDIDALGERLAFAGVPGRDDGATLRIDDPWGNVLRLSVGEHLAG